MQHSSKLNERNGSKPKLWIFKTHLLHCPFSNLFQDYEVAGACPNYYWTKGGTGRVLGPMQGDTQTHTKTHMFTPNLE